MEATKEWDITLSETHTAPFNDMTWVTKLLYDENSEVNGAPALADLQDSLRNAIHGKQHLGQANQDTIYFQAWKGIAQHISPDISNGYWEEEGKVTDAMLRNVNKSKTGQIWHKGKAFLWKMPYMPGWPIATDNLCPLCGKPDSQSHILGGCAHPEMKKMVIYRHDEAHRIIINAINKGNLGSFAIVADVGTAASLRNLGVHYKRISEWVLPNSMLALHSQDPNTLRDKLRPDVMLIELEQHEQAEYQGGGRKIAPRTLTSSVNDPRSGYGRPRKIWPMEGRYCSDTEFKEKLAEKTVQHVKILRTYGYDVRPGPMPLGYAGTIYINNLSVLQELGLSRSAAKTVLKRLHLHAISCLHNLLRREDTWNAMVDMQCKLEEEEEMWQASPSYSTPLLSGQPGILPGFSLNERRKV